ncbi:MAG: DUF3597 domain-containing protein [Verrucomicrobiales bacterium]|nr:DUF3597 domain-containing protein [Verrucomicrobiales bacterium]
MFSDLMGRIFGKDKEEEAPTPAPEPAAEEVAPGDAPAASEAAPSEAPAGTEEAPAAAASPEPIAQVDVAAILTKMEAEHPEDLDWKRSIVDLMKLVGMDSSYGARKELALELGYSQADIDSKGSAEMNMWLHKQVMKSLAENGGKVPADLLD